MSLFKKNEDLLDDAVAQVANEPIDSRQVEEAAGRVWARLSQEAAAGTAAVPVVAEAVPVVGSFHGCEDFQSLIPGYLRGELPPARALLVEDHTRTCVPCRRALKEAREGRSNAVRPAAAARPVNRAVWLSPAAALILTLGVGTFMMLREFFADGSQMARIESVEGTLYRVAGDSSRPIAAGEMIDEGEEVRTAKGSTALVRMTDGSMIEMSERAGLSLDAAGKGNTIQLDRGKIIVHAAKQRQRHLYVATKDAQVSVTGTIFAVNSGTKGSRVSVVEGEVRVKQARTDSILHPGDQVTTHASVEAVPVRQEVAWSRNKAQYEALLAELTALGKDIDARVARPGLRYSTRLLDLAPEGTTIYVALPNLASSLEQTLDILDEKKAESPTLAQWWKDTLGSTRNEAKFQEMIQKIGDLGKNLGDEVAIAMSAEDDGPGEPVLLAQVANPAAFRAVLEAEIARLNGLHGHNSLLLVDDPATAPEGDAMLLWVGGDLFVATPSAARLRQVAALAGGGTNPFASSEFRNRIAQDYQDGAGWLFAADLHTLVNQGHEESSEGDRVTAEQLGILDMQYFIIDRREIDGKAETRAALTFDQQRRGVASWLAQPAPMGSLSFFSPDANLAAAFVVKSPVSILDELLAINPEFAGELAEAQARHGFDLRNDLAAPLGGEVAMAVDGPVLPSPSWKLVVEVYDPARLQATIERAVAHLNDELRNEGKPPVQLTAQTAGGHTFHAVRGTQPKVELHYLFEDGYLLAAPSRALLERSLQQRASGVTLASAAKFRDLLGPDGQVNVSALVYQNLAPLAKSANKVLPESMKGNGQQGGPAAIGRYLMTQGPTLYYAYAEPDRIVFAGSNQNPLGLNLGTLAGFGSILGGMREAHGAAQSTEEAR